MAESDPSGPQPAPGPPPAARPVTVRASRRGGGPLRWLLVLALLAAAGYGAWHGARWARATFEAVSAQQELLARLARDVGALRAQADELSNRQTDLSAAVRRNGADLATLGGRLEDSEEAVARLSETVEGGRTRLQLAAVEQLLLMANDRLLLARDARSALRALDLADQRIGALADPRLYRIREALAQERAAVAALALPDTAGIALTLADLIRRVPQLPLRGRVPERFHARGEETYAPPDAGAGQRLWAAIKTALSNIFALRRTDGPKPRLLSADEEALVVQILQLKLDGARLAALSVDGRTFTELAAVALVVVLGEPALRAGGVRVAAAELERLAGLDLAPAPPDISRSLALLRAHLGAAPR
jgi:uroporphyrin-III C-methyltransferase